MSSLTETSITTKKMVWWIVGIFVAYIIIKSLIGFAVQYWKKTHPPPLPLPNVLFNKLPKPDFNSTLSTSGMKFTLQNIEGKPPETTMSAKVYNIPKKSPTFSSDDKAQKLATKLGFNAKPDNIDSIYYSYIDPKEAKRTLALDIANFNFKLSYDYNKNPQDIFQNLGQTSREKALAEVKNFIRFNSLFDDSILNGKISTDILRFDPIINGFTPASSLANTQVVRVNFFRSDLDNLKILPPNFSKSYNYALFLPSANPKTQILELSFTFWPIEFDNFATYPLRSGQDAWKDFTDGYASIINLGNNNKEERIVIRKIYLAYYDSLEPQSFLQPIFVFEGDNDFVAYLPAISFLWLG